MPLEGKRFEGDKEFQDRVDRYRTHAPDAFGAALHELGLAIMADSVKMVPVDTGRLRSSAFVSGPRKSHGSVFVMVGYGTRYALAVHESVGEVLRGEERQGTYPNGAEKRGNYWDSGESKFLSKALNKWKTKALRHLAKASEEFIATGKKMRIRKGDFPRKPPPTFITGA